MRWSDATDVLSVVTNDAVVVLDGELRFRAVSRGFERRTGHAAAALIGRSWRAAVADDATIDGVEVRLREAATGMDQRLRLHWTGAHGSMLSSVVDVRSLTSAHPVGLLLHIEFATSARASASADTGPCTCAIDDGEPETADRRLSHAVRAKLDRMSAAAQLTPRERSVLTLLAAGRRREQIGSELGISINTVKFHQARVLHKLGAGSRSELFAFFV